MAQVLSFIESDLIRDQESKSQLRDIKYLPQINANVSDDSQQPPLLLLRNLSQVVSETYLTAGLICIFPKAASVRAATASRRLPELTRLTGNSLETAELMENLQQRPRKRLGSFHFQNVKMNQHYFRLDLICMVQVTRFQIIFPLKSHRSDL